MIWTNILETRSGCQMDVDQ